MERKTTIAWIIGVVIIAGCGFGIYWYFASQSVYIDKSVIEAPLISLSASNSGLLQEIYVNDGDSVTLNEPIALVGDQVVKAKVDGLIVTVNKNIGQLENPIGGQAIVATMIDPTQLRVVGTLDEDKGLADVKVGETARFTVDAFGSKSYYGVVDEISETSVASVTNNIFNQRPTNQFDVYLRFKSSQYPELKSGMSARIWVYKK
jgi:multidrug resistance efflux pump